MNNIVNLVPNIMDLEPLIQESANLFFKGPTVNISDLCGN